MTGTQPGTSERASDASVPSSRAVAIAAARAAAEKQAGEIVILDVRELIVITDYFVIATAGTKRQIRTVIEAIEDTVRGMGEKPTRREGESDGGWWLIDYIDVVVHVFGLEERDYYDLERLWRDAPRVEWEPSEAASSSG